MRIHPGDAHGRVRDELPLQGRRELVGLGLFLVRVDHPIDVAPDARDRPEVRPVRIEVDLAGLVQLVAVVIVPVPGRRRRAIEIDAGEIRLQLAQLIEAPIPTLDHGLAVAHHVERGVHARPERVEGVQVELVEALGRRKRRGLAALIRRIRRLVVEAEPQVERHPAREGPRVLPIHAEVLAVVQPLGRRVPRVELEGRAVVEHGAGSRTRCSRPMAP